MKAATRKPLSGNPKPTDTFASQSFILGPSSCIFALLLVVATLLAYLPVWKAGFIWDDDVMVTANTFMQSATGLRDIWTSAGQMDYFPMTSTFLWAQWRLWGASPLGYHVVNVVLHILSALWWWRALARLRMPGAWLAAAIFALHPVNVESVAWISEVKNTLAMFFFTLTLWAWGRSAPGARLQGSGEENSKFETHAAGWYGLSLGFFALALLSKTAVVMLPFVLLGITWFRLSTSRPQDGLRPGSFLFHPSTLRLVPFFALSLALGLITIWFQYHKAIGSTVVRTDNFWSRLAGAGWAFWFYLGKALWPANLIPVYPRWEISSANLLSYLPGALLLAALGAGWRWWRSWGKSVLFGLGYFIVMLLPVLGFFDISFMRYSLVADRWQYFAIMGPIALVSAGISTRLKFETRSSNSLQTSNSEFRALTPISLALLITLGILTWRQCRIFESPETLWSATIARNPNSQVAQNNFANLAFSAGQIDEAKAHYQKALELDPNYAEALSNLGVVLLRQGQVDQAITHFQRALEIEPQYAEANNNLANALIAKGQIEEAIRHLETALKVMPFYAEARYNLGNAFTQLGRIDDAIRQYERALEIRPDYPAASGALGWLLLQGGRTEEALARFQTVLKFHPDSAEARNTFGNALLSAGRFNEAIAQYEAALKSDPNLANVHNNLGWSLLQAGRRDEAMVHLNRALELDPDYANAHNNLAIALLQQGRVREAITHCQTVLKLRPDDVETLSNLAWLLATWPEAGVRDATQALALAGRAVQLTNGKDPSALRSLAAAQAEAGRCAEAAATAQQAIQLADAKSDRALANALREQLKVYQAGVPFRDAMKAGSRDPKLE